jgi:hypothetical protein
LGTPPARAFLMTLESATFFSGSAEPPRRAAIKHKPHTPLMPEHEHNRRESCIVFIEDLAELM